MKKLTREWVRKAESDYRGANQLARSRPPVHDLICFCSQQCAEKYLKALVEEQGLVVPRTHDLEDFFLIRSFRILQASYVSTIIEEIRSTMIECSCPRAPWIRCSE